MTYQSSPSAAAPLLNRGASLRHNIALSFLTTLSCLIITSPASAIDIDFVPSFSADYFDSGNWSPTQVPTFTDDAFVRSGGTPQAWSGGTVQVNSLTVGDVLAAGDGSFNSRVDVEVVDNLIVGGMADSDEITSNQNADGNFHMSQANLLQIQSGALEHDFQIGVLNVSNGSNGSATGRATIDNVNTVTLGDDVRVSATRNWGGNTSTSGIIGSVDWSRIDDLTVAGNLDFSRTDLRGVNAIASSDVSSSIDISFITNFTVGGDLGFVTNYLEATTASPFRLSHDALATAATGGGSGILSIENFDIAGDLEIATADLEFDAGGERVLSSYRAALEFVDIDNMSVGGDFNLHHLRGNVEDSPLEFQQVLSNASNAANFSLVSLDVTGGSKVGVLELSSSSSAPQISARYEMATQLYLELSSMTTGDTMSVGTIAGNANVPASLARGFLPMVGSSLTAPELRMGLVENPGVSGVAEAEVLLVSSLIDTESLVQGPGASIRFVLDGLDRIDLATLDGATFPTLDGKYSGIDAADALLEGDIISDFDFVPPSPGTYSFDLVITDSLTALDDIDADLSIIDLPEDFCVIFYGVTEETGVDVLRLTISTECIPEPSSALLVLIGVSISWMRRAN